MSLPHPAELLPHRGRMLLIDRLLSHDGQATTCRVRADGEAWLAAEDGTLPAWLALEYMAQCLAADEGLRAREAGEPPVRGLLVGARHIELMRPRLAPGQALTVTTRRRRGRPGLGALRHEGEVRDAEGRLLARGDVTVALARGPGAEPAR